MTKLEVRREKAFQKKMFRYRIDTGFFLFNDIDTSDRNGTYAAALEGVYGSFWRCCRSQRPPARQVALS